MGNSAFKANLVAWGIALVVSGGFLVWYSTSGDPLAAFSVVSGSVILQWLMIASGPLLLFSAGAIVGSVIAHLRKMSMGVVVRRVLIAVPAVVLALFLLCPLTVVALPAALKVPFAIALVLGLQLPYVFAVLGLMLGLASIAEPRASEPAPIDSDEEGEW